MSVAKKGISPPIEPSADLTSQELDEFEFTNLKQKMIQSVEQIYRRTFDIVCSIFALIVFSPVLLLIAIMIRLDSKGPALFRQIRVGKDGKPFHFYKFRTMYADAKQRFPELYEYKYTPKEIEELKFKIENDPRVTRLGRKLRPTSLDELPNFFNVLIGNMTMVGPRPDIPEMTKYYTPEQMTKLSQKPGLTGYAQVNGRGHLNLQDTLEEDVRYIRERSILVDIYVIWRTVCAVFTGNGAF